MFPPPIDDSQRLLLFSAAHKDIEKARAQLLDIQNQILELQRTERHWKQEIEMKSRLLKMGCFINKLADEIVVDIFTRLVMSDLSGSGEGRCYPWRLVAVCKRWRRISLDNPILWSQFNLVDGHWGCKHPMGGRYEAWLVSRTMLQLERSLPAPLVVRVGAFCTCPVQVSRFRALVKHSCRWKAIEFTGIRTNADVGSLRDLLPPTTRFLALQNIGWRSPREPARGDAIQFPFMHTGENILPALNSLALHCAILKDSDLDTRLPWGQLTTLKLEELMGGDVAVLQSVLSQCQNLENLSLSTSGHLEGTGGNRPAITLPHLLTIRIRDSVEASIMTHIIPRLRLPSLQSLTTNAQCSLESIAELIKQSSCAKSLTTLSLSTYFLSEPFFGILGSCLNMKSLNLVNSSMCNKDSDLFARQITSKLVVQEDSSETLCPRLQELHLDGFKLDPVLVVQMIDSRLNSNCSAMQHDLSCIAIKYPIRYGAGDEPIFFKALLEEKYLGASAKGGFHLELEYVIAFDGREADLSQRLLLSVPT